jgi:hypothetical protein
MLHLTGCWSQRDSIGQRLSCDQIQSKPCFTIPASSCQNLSDLLQHASVISVFRIQPTSLEKPSSSRPCQTRKCVIIILLNLVRTFFLTWKCFSSGRELGETQLFPNTCSTLVLRSLSCCVRKEFANQHNGKACKEVKPILTSLHAGKACKEV